MKYGGFPINCPLNQSIESPQVFTGMCHCYHFVCYFCFADVFACICLKPEAYTIAINCTHNDIYLSLYVYIFIYISIQQPSRWGWLLLLFVGSLTRWSNCLWNWLFHVRIVPFPFVLCHTSVKFYLLLFAKSDLFDADWLVMLFQLYASYFVHIQWQRHIISNLMTHMNPTAISSIWSCQVKQIVIPINLSSLSDVYKHK